MTDLALPWVPMFWVSSPTGQFLDFTYPLLRWEKGARTEGRMLTSIIGAQGVDLRLRKYLLFMTLRFTEEEWPMVRALFAHGQAGSSMLWYPRARDPSVPDNIEVWLESPRVDQGISPTRDSALLWLFTQQLVVSRTSAPWETEYFLSP